MIKKLNIKLHNGYNMVLYCTICVSRIISLSVKLIASTTLDVVLGKEDSTFHYVYEVTGQSKHLQIFVEKSNEIIVFCFSF